MWVASVYREEVLCKCIDLSVMLNVVVLIAEDAAAGDCVLKLSPTVVALSRRVKYDRFQSDLGNKPHTMVQTSMSARL